MQHIKTKSNNLDCGVGKARKDVVRDDFPEMIMPKLRFDEQ